MVKSLTGSDMRKAQISAIRRNANIIKRRAYLNFSQLRTKSRRGSGRLSDSVYQGKRLRTVTVKVAKKTSQPTVFVHIMGDFRAKFFEGGTKERSTLGRKVVGYTSSGRRSYKKRTGKGRRTGRIQQGRYFQRAIRSSISEIERNMEQDIISAMAKAASKQ